jgi:hypothetical protein
MVKCSKCGANIPDEAGFCPSCGAPKAGEQRAPQATYRPMTPSNSRGISPLEGIFDMAFSKTAIILVIALGILFAWIGTVIMIFAAGSADIATLLSSMGFAAMGLFLAAGGIWNSKIDKFVRLAMVLIGIFLVAQSLSISGLLSSMMSGLSSYMSGFSSFY